MRRCYAITKQLKLCKRDSDRLFFCAEHRSAKYVIGAVVLALGALGSIASIHSAWLSRKVDQPTIRSVDVDVTMFEDNRELPGKQNPYPGTAGKLPVESTLTYVYERHDDILKVSYKMPYLKTLLAGGPISPLPWSVVEDNFFWEYPKLAIKIVNNSDRTLLLTEASLEVTSSRVNTEPLLLIKASQYGAQYIYDGHGYVIGLGTFHLINEGWGDVINAFVDYDAIARGPNMIKFSRAKGTLMLGTFAERKEVVIIPDIAQPAIKFPSNCPEHPQFADVTGRIGYETLNHQHREVKFATHVLLASCMQINGVSMESSAYSTMLEAGKDGYVKYVPIAQELKPGETDNFLLQLGSDKSAHFDFNLSLREANGLSMPTKAVSIDVFVPRSALASELDRLSLPNLQHERQMNPIPTGKK